MKDVPDPAAPNDVLGVWPPSEALKAEVTDAAWSDYGRMVHQRIMSQDMVVVLARAGLKSKTTIEMVGYIRAFILTGTKP